MNDLISLIHWPHLRYQPELLLPSFCFTLFFAYLLKGWCKQKYAPTVYIKDQMTKEDIMQKTAQKINTAKNSVKVLTLFFACTLSMCLVSVTGPHENERDYLLILIDIFFSIVVALALRSGFERRMKLKPR